MKRITSFLLAIILFAGLVLTGAPTVYAASDLAVSDDLVNLIKKFEGFYSKPYWDYVQYSVGYGTRCPDDKLEEYMENGIPKEEAEALLRKYISGTEKAVNQRMADKNKLNLTQGQFDALVSFSYNCGTAWLSDSTSNLYKSIVGGATGSKLIDAFVRWSKAGGKFLTGLINRRLCEANMYLNGKYSKTAPDNFCYVFLDPNGGDVASTIQGYDSSETVKIYHTPTYDGREFKGWYTAKTGGSKVTKLKQSHSGTTLYARWGDAEGSEETTPALNITVTVTAGDVNLRTGPGTNYDKAGQAQQGDKLTITETASGSGYLWGKAGDVWIALEFTNYETVIKNPEEETKPEETKPEETKPEETVPEETKPENTVPEVDNTKVTGTVNTDNLPVRKEPKSGATVVKKLKKGTKVTITQRKTVGSTVWGKISDGWISVKRVDLDPIEPEVDTTKVTGKVNLDNLPVRKEPKSGAAVVKKLKKGTKVTITKRMTVDGTVWGYIGDGWISVKRVNLDAVEPEVDTTKVTGKVNLDNLPVRKEPKSGAAVVKKLKKGTKVTITKRMTVDGTVWGYIGDGWISVKRVDLDKADSSATSGTEKITGTVKVNGRLTVRKGAGTGYAVVKYLSNGAKVTITKTKTVSGTKWGYIGDGWISMDYVVVK